MKGCSGWQSDPDLRVAFQLACTLGRLPAQQSFEPLQRIAARNLEDFWFQIAVLSSAADQSIRWFQAFTREKGFLEQPSKMKEEFLARIAAIAGARQRNTEIAEIVRFVEQGTGGSGPWWRAASLNGLAEGVKRGAEKQPHLSGATEQSLFRLLDDRSPGVGVAALDLLSATKVSDSPHVRAAVKKTSATALNSQTELESRLNAIRVLGLDPTRASIPVLAGLLGLKEPVKLQATAVAALWHTGDARVPGMLLEKWKAYPVPVREAVLAGFFADPKLLMQLLDAVEDRRVEPLTLGRTRITQLTRSRDEVVTKRARTLLAKVLAPDRQSVLNRYRPALTLKGDLLKGKEVFRANCASCHKVATLRVVVGPRPGQPGHTPLEGLSHCRHL